MRQSFCSYNMGLFFSRKCSRYPSQCLALISQKRCLSSSPIWFILFFERPLRHFCPFRAFTGTSGTLASHFVPGCLGSPPGSLPAAWAIRNTMRTLVSLSSFSWWQAAENPGMLMAECWCYVPLSGPSHRAQSLPGLCWYVPTCLGIPAQELTR